MGALILYAGKAEEEQKVEEGWWRCLCMRFMGGICITASVWFCVLVARYDFMTMCDKRGFPTLPEG